MRRGQRRIDHRQLAGQVEISQRRIGFHALLLEVSVPARRRFQLVLVKPSHYDDDGYVIRWWRAMIPSNSLGPVLS